MRFNQKACCTLKKQEGVGGVMKTRIHVVQGDITKLAVDVIVNAVIRH